MSRQITSSPHDDSSFNISEDEEFEKFRSRKEKRKKSNEDNDKEVKLMMLGDSGVGKSKLIMKYLCDDVSLNLKKLKNFK